MIVPCPFCGEIDTEKLEVNLWELHKSVGGHQLYCPKCGKYMNLDHAINVNSVLHGVEINRG